MANSIIVWNVANQGARSLREMRNEEMTSSHFPMTKMEAETFQDMIARGVNETMDVASIYRIEK